MSEKSTINSIMWYVIRRKLMQQLIQQLRNHKYAKEMHSLQPALLVIAIQEFQKVEIPDLYEYQNFGIFQTQFPEFRIYCDMSEVNGSANQSKN